ncbi:hypothetical protein [Viridibacillus arvi]|nr:hypothetical protein [Viridibacillus arvi]
MEIAAEVATSKAVWAILCISLAGVVIRELHKLFGSWGCFFVSKYLYNK